MHRYRSKLREFCWIAIVAILFASIGSTATRVFAQASGSTPAVGEICTAVAGDRSASVPGHAFGSTDPFDDERAQHGTAECPYCATHAFSFALPPGPDQVAARPAQVATATPFLPSLPRLPDLGLGATPRGPPLAS